MGVITIMGTIVAWVILPRILRWLHRYSEQGQGARLPPPGSISSTIPYEKSFWGTLDAAVRNLIFFMAFSLICMVLAPTTIKSQYIGPTWRGAFILSFVWFLHRLKTNVISRALVIKSVEGIDRDKLLTLDNFSSAGLFVLGGMALAEACGVAVQSILTVGGIGGVAIAFAARDILGNVLSGLSLQLSQPFSIGDTIKVGSVEGQVIKMRLTTTSLISAEKFLIEVPNSRFSSQAIVNKSRAGWHEMVSKIPVQIDDFNRIPHITEEIKNMMTSNSNVFLEKEQPYCYLSRDEKSFAELSLECHLKERAIVKRSYVGWHEMASKIPVQIDDFNKIRHITEEIKNMMKSNSNVFLEKEPQYCYVSRVAKSLVELTLECYLKQMSNDELFSAERDVLLQSIQIIKKHGADLARDGHKIKSVIL